MSVDEWGMTPRQNERLRAVLQDDERVVMVAAPRCRMRLSAAIGPVLLGVVILAFLGSAAYMFGRSWWVVAFFFSPFWLLALVLLSVPLRYRWRMARTLYVLTNKRAIVFEQLRLWHNRCVCWPLFPGLVKKVTKEGDKLGSLIFDYEMRFSFESRRRWCLPQPVGFLMVPQPEQVQQLVAEQVAAVPPEEAPFAYRPSILKTPAPKLDAWGTPLAEQPWDKKHDRRFFIVFGAVLILLGLLSLGQGGYMLHTESRLETEGVRASATVVKVVQGGSHRSYYPTLRFKDATGCERTVDYSIPTEHYPRGHRLNIVYLPADPAVVRIENPDMSSVWAVLLGGVLFAAFGGVILTVGLRSKS